MIVNVEPSAQFPYALYARDPAGRLDLITMSMPLSLVAQKSHRHHRASEAVDQALLDGLARKGFRLDFGEDGTGWQFKYLTARGGYYFNVGCSDLIVKGEVGLVQFADIAGFVAEGAQYERRNAAGRPDRAGDRLRARVCWSASCSATRCERGPIWGSATSRSCDMFTRTPQAGTVVHCRLVRSMPHLFEISRRCRSRRQNWVCCRRNAPRLDRLADIGAFRPDFAKGFESWRQPSCFRARAARRSAWARRWRRRFRRRGRCSTRSTRRSAKSSPRSCGRGRPTS